jgi:Flp pilus assembly protein TadB
MALADHEKRELEEIEQRLFAEDPKFAAKLTKPSVLAFLSGRTMRLLGGLVVYLCGLMVVIAGVTWASVPVVVLGGVVCAGVFAGLLYLAWRSQRD